MTEIYIGQLPRPVDGEHIYVDESINNVIMGFWGDCHAVRLVYRGPNDSHICFEIMTHDDGHWFVSHFHASSSWMPSLIELLSTAHKWMVDNAIPDIHGRQFGYNI